MNASSEVDEEEIGSLEQNLKRMNLLAALRGIGFFVPVFVPFLESFGLGLVEIFWLQALFGGAMAVLEVPSGYLADRIGRKALLIAGAVAWLLGFALYAVSSGFAGFLGGELLLAVGCSFFSGADQALFYDSVKRLNRAEQFPQLLARQRFYWNCAEAASSVLGGLVASWSLRTPIFLQLGTMVAVLILTLTLVEPGGTERKGPGKLRDALGGALEEHPELMRTLGLSAAVGLSTLMMVWFTQPWLASAGVPLVAFGVIWALLRLSVGASALLAPRLLQNWGFKPLVVLSVVLISSGYLLTALFPTSWMVPALLLFGAGRGLSMVGFSDAINRLVSSERRATVLSLESLLVRLLYLPLAPALAWLGDLKGLSAPLGVAAVLFLLAPAWLLFWRGETRTERIKGLRWNPVVR